MHPQPLFSIGSLSVYPYGICMAVGIIACFAFLMFTMWKKNFNEDATDKILFIGVFGTGFGIFSAALFQGLYNYIENPSGGFSLSGMTFIGGLIGGVVSFLGVYSLYMYVIAPRTKIKFLQNNMNATITDALPFIPAGIAIAHAFGRLGCFFGGCCYGKQTDAWYGLFCARSYSELTGAVTMGERVVPLQLFEMAFLIVLAAVMIFLYFKFKFNYNFGLYAVAYGIWRFGIEFARGDDRGQFIGTALSPSQFWSILMVVIGVGYFFLQYYVLSKYMKHPELQPSVRKSKSGEKAAAVAVSVEGSGAEQPVENEVQSEEKTAENGGDKSQNGEKQ